MINCKEPLTLANKAIATVALGCLGMLTANYLEYAFNDYYIATSGAHNSYRTESEKKKKRGMLAAIILGHAVLFRNSLQNPNNHTASLVCKSIFDSFLVPFVLFETLIFSGISPGQKSYLRYFSPIFDPHPRW